MRELSLNILDIAQNSIAAGASLTRIEVAEDTAKHELTITVSDNGCGMTQEQVDNVLDPFFTTRTTRKVGMGIPLFKLAAEQTGGCLRIESEKGKGTTTSALFKTDSIDFTPLGDVTATITTLIQGHPDTDFLFIHNFDGKQVELDTRQMRDMLEGIPLNSYEVIKWAEDYLNEQYGSLYDI